MAAFLLPLGLFCSCGIASKSMVEATMKEEQVDSVKDFIPLHPPIVIRRSMNEKK